MERQLTLNDITKQLMYGKGFKESEVLEHWDYRKGKSIEDLRNAVRKGLKNGLGKTEVEEDMITMYLGDVFKKKRKPKKESVAE